VCLFIVIQGIRFHLGSAVHGNVVGLNIPLLCNQVGVDFVNLGSIDRPSCCGNVVQI
jgi:hypothetical protein